MLQLRTHFNTIGLAGIFLAVFFTPINKPLTNIGLLLLLLGFVFGTARQYYAFKATVKNPVFLGAFLWFFVLFLNHLFSILSNSKVEPFISSILSPLLLIPFAIFVHFHASKNKILVCFAISVGLVTLASWMQFLHIIPTHRAGALAYTIFKEYTQQGLQTLIFSSLCFSFALTSKIRNHQFTLAALGGWGLITVVFVLGSRTSILTLVPLLGYWLVVFGFSIIKIPSQKMARRNLVLITVLTLLLGALFWQSSVVQERVVSGIYNEVSTYLQQRAPTSTGIRIEIWSRSIDLFQERPWFGYGIGQWSDAFNTLTKNYQNYEPFRMGHPHQEALLFLIELGLIGVVVWIALLLGLLRHIHNLSAPYKHFYTSLFIIYITAGLANCLWPDFTHRHTFLLLLACMPMGLLRSNEVEKS